MFMKTRRKAEIQAWLAENADGALIADGFDAAIIGVGERLGLEPMVVYDIDRCIDILVKRDGMERDAAIEFFSFNVMGAWPGERAPLYVWTLPVGLRQKRA